ncbi:MAG: EAL domain-containing protein, partial [Actinomycetes bacterium]
VEVRGDLVMATAAIQPPHSALFADETTDRTNSGAAGERRQSPPNHRLEVDVVWLAAERQFVVTHHDVTERHELESQLAYQAFHDELTGLSNRVVFRAGLRQAADRSGATHKPFIVMMLDLDDFKDVNDSLGHPAGDDLLRVVGQRLTECMREGDVPVRLGGDEFAVILESAETVADAQAVGARILEALRQPVQLHGTQVRVGASIGIAVGDGASDPTDIERNADIALYEAKFNGKSRVAVFQGDMLNGAARNASLTSYLRGAVKRGEFIVRYQPILELRTGHIAGVEAQIRWQHPDRGELGAEQFVPAAEKTGDINEIGRFALRQALSDLSALTRHHPRHAGLRLSLKVPARKLVNDGVAEQLSSALAAAGVEPERVIFEVSENLLPDVGAATRQVQQITDLGLSVYVSDFATGSASLGYLRTLPISGVKLAKGLVDGLPADFETGLILAIRDLSESLELDEPVADGVNSAGASDSLIELGYRLGQGDALSEPVLIDDLERILATNEPAPWRGSNHQRVQTRQTGRQ